MKFIIRDDDVNYFYNPSQLEKWYKDIFEICPISICAIPFVKGDFFKWCFTLENHLPFDKEAFYKDDQIYKIGDNKDMVDKLKEWIADNKVSISMHGIFHRNPDKNADPVKNNYITGAEFFTKNNITSEIIEAKEYLSSVFEVNVTTFTAPQNMISKMGFKSIEEAGMNICVDLPPLREPNLCISIYGLLNYLNLVKYWFTFGNCRKHYPFVIVGKHNSILSHFRLQPQIDVMELYREIDRVYNQDGIFVLSTHSYGFDTKMEECKGTMKNALLDILDYVDKKGSIQYTTLENVF